MHRILNFLFVAWLLISTAYAQSFVFTGSNAINAALWNSVAISANGQSVYVPTFPGAGSPASPGTYFSSQDAGATWTKQSGSGNHFWVEGCTSSDGTIVYGADQYQGSGNGGYIYKSSDRGVTWGATNSPQLQWQQVSCSSDGTKLVACVGTQTATADLYTSIDGGTTWVDQTGSLSRDWQSCTISGDGAKIAASNALGHPNGDGGVYVSTNWQSGSPTWAANIFAANGSTFASSVAYSRDGSTIYAAFNANGSTSHIFVSTNDGSTWSDVNPPGGTAGQRSWLWVATSANGQKVVATNISSISLFISSNAGVTWTTVPESPIGPTNHQNPYFAISDNGQIIVSATFVGYISVSLDGGVTWRVTSATGP